MTSIITTKNLGHTYRSGQTQPALSNINLEIARGSCVAIIGVTGSGKSTLVQHFNGLLRPTVGSIIVDGIEVATGTDLQSLRQRVGMLFQFPEAQLFASTVFADVAFGPQRLKLGRREVRSRAIAALETVGLPYQIYAQRSPFELSGGQRRRVALAGIMAMLPTVLVLDEPTAGLDAEARAEFYSYLRRVQAEGVTIILVSHDMTEVATLADWLFILHEGHLVMQGTPRTVFAAGDSLRDWGLLPPPLSELLMLLRQQGVTVPMETLTLEEALAVLGHGA